MKELDTFVKIVVVGDSCVGKTWFLHSFVHQRVPEISGPTVFENLNTQFVVDGIEYELSLWDTPGAPERRKMRCLSYKNADVFIMCYSVDSRASFENVRFRWLPEIRKKCPGVPRILLGLKSDLKPKVPNPVTSKDGEFMQYELHCPSFFEYSVKREDMLPQIFENSIRLALQKKLHFRKQSGCSIQ